MSGEKGFLDRWSARKRNPEADRQAPGAIEAPDTATLPAEAAQEKTDAEILEELGLPDPDALGPGDDFKRFMAEAVPSHLRTRALRKLWVSNPVLANLDELLDYGDDFTDAATVVENLQTAYKAGRGFLRDLTEESPEELLAESPAGDEPGSAEADLPAGEKDLSGEVVAADPAPLPDPVSHEIQQPSAPISASTDHSERSAPRRMRFQFPDAL